MAKLNVIIGLPGSGKSFRLKELIKSGEIASDCVYHDYHADAPSDEVEDSLHYDELIAKLKSGKNCAVADIAWCAKERREQFISIIKKAVPSVEIKIQCFEKKPDVCKRNVEYASKQRATRRIQKINEFAPDYDIPADVEILKIWDSSHPQK